MALRERIIKPFDCSKFSDSSKKVVLKVDLQYSKTFDDLHDIPFCPQNIIWPKRKHKKCIADLNDKM